ncbi:MAG: uracil-DNA glycosylase [bacterium]
MKPATNNAEDQRESPTPTAWFRADCRDCARLAAFLAQVKREHNDYLCQPVPPWGAPDAELLIVGLAPGLHGANATGRPFTGDHAGLLLYRTLHRFGFATAPQSRARGDGLALRNCRITNAVKCLPPANKPRGDEVARCNRYLAAELAEPHLKLVLALGQLAHRAVLRAFGLPQRSHPFAHNARHRIAGGPLLFDSYHCSRYNTNTRRLTEAMFHQVFARIAAQLAR